MTDDEIVAKAKSAIMDMAIGDMKKAAAAGIKVGGFILTSCAIDYLACLHAGRDAGGQGYRQFINEFFEKNPYSTDDLYYAIRCKLVHNYTVKDGKYWFVNKSPQSHLAQNSASGLVMLNLEDFINDVESAARKHFAFVDSDASAKARLISRVRNVGILEIKAPVVVAIS